MSEIVLNVSKRLTGKKAAKSVRNSGNVPGVFYLNGIESVSIAAHAKSLRPIVYTKDARIVKLNIEGDKESHDCVLKDVTFDPVTDVITHFDLHGFSADQLVEFEVPIKVVGTAIGIRDGGILEQILLKVHIMCLPSQLPEHIDVDVTALKINQTIHVGDLSVSNVRFVTKSEQTVVAVHHARTEHASVAPAGAIEPELVGQKGKKDDK